MTQASPPQTLFVYGTLRCPDCLQSILGRTASLTPDLLQGFRRDKLRLGKARYPVVYPDPGAMVEGFRIEVDDHELTLLDEYETDAYQRERVRLESGLEAWVYRGAS